MTSTVVIRALHEFTYIPQQTHTFHILKKHNYSETLPI